MNDNIKNEKLRAAMQFAAHNRKPTTPPTAQAVGSSISASTTAQANTQTNIPANTQTNAQPTPTTPNSTPHNTPKKTVITEHASTILATQTSIQTGNATSSTQATKDNTPPAIKKVDINIIGSAYRINCPIDEVSNLTHSANAINDALKGIRRNVRGKTPNNEELLVLYCLELYDELQSTKKQLADQQHKEQAALDVMNRLIKETG
ncbi:MAG: cell division protein ZapA [Moraxella sp.]|nr:cell division protein ZapA [Moraxella sp.]